MLRSSLIRSAPCRLRRGPIGSRGSPPSGSAWGPRSRGRRRLEAGSGRGRGNRRGSSCALFASRVLRVHRLKDSHGRRGRGKSYLASRPSPTQRLSRGIDAMKRESSRRTRTGPEYRIRVSFGVPLDFAFAWCTDYTPEDASLEGESYTRKIIERTPHRVIFEDLEDAADGWVWGRDVVTLQPPNRWH